MKRFQDRVFEWFQRRCPHRPKWVRADILEGDGLAGYYVQWCLRCGAYRRGGLNRWKGDWREPRATWATEKVKDAEA